VSTHPSVITAHSLDSTGGNTAISTYNGHAFDIFNPDSWVFDLDEIAQALSNTCRFGGHVEFYSVAEHCIRVAHHLEDEGFSAHTQLIGLMHDAIEAYIGDIPRPIKKTFMLDGEAITDLEKGMELSMFHAYGLLSDDFDDEWGVVKHADWRIYELERDERPNVGQGLLPSAAKRAWLQHYQYLVDKL
jgi:uncharacterized protein